MDCQRCQDVLDDLLVSAPSGPDYAEMMDHIAACPRCSQEHRFAGKALATLAIERPHPSTAGLRKRILAEAARLEAGPAERTPPRASIWESVRMSPIAMICLAASLLVAAALLFLRTDKEPGETPVFTLLSRAYAEEASIFAGNRIVHIVNEIDVNPVANEEIARARWLPLMSLEATGKPRFHQLSLTARAGEGYKIVDDVWYEPATGRFARQMVTGGRPIYANSYDGRDVYWLNVAEDGGSRLEKRAAAPEFQPPQNPEMLLGIAAGSSAQLDKPDKRLVTDAGETRLDDGTMARRVRVAYPRPGGDETPVNAFVLFTIRKDDKSIARIEFVVEGESLYQVNRIKTETVDRNDVAWNLAGLEETAVAESAAPRPELVPDMVLRDVSVDHMVEKAGFPTYIFQATPAWTNEGQITDVLDLPSPPHRMFAIAYVAKDGRHVVLVQATTFNSTMGQFMANAGKVVYTSPAGVKVFSGAQDKWLAGILLDSARASFSDPPSDERTGYVLETPQGTYPVLAINGKLSDDELHALVDSLALAKGAE